MTFRTELVLGACVGAMIRENRQLVTNKPVEFENKPVEVQGCMKFTDHFRGYMSTGSYWLLMLRLLKLRSVLLFRVEENIKRVGC